MKLPHVIETDLSDEMVLLDPRTREVFTLNAVGRVIWEHLDRGVAEVVARVIDEFDITHEAATKDCETLLQQLSQAGLISAAQS